MSVLNLGLPPIDPNEFHRFAELKVKSFLHVHVKELKMRRHCWMYVVSSAVVQKEDEDGVILRRCPNCAIAAFRVNHCCDPAMCPF